MPQIFSGKKSGNAAVQAVYKKKLQTFPQRHVPGENPAKGQNSREVSPATCRWRKGRNVAGESIECCSVQ
ncbi:hypothetical protein Tco_1452769, partial [Tanacetum coccineum]